VLVERKQAEILEENIGNSRVVLEASLIRGDNLVVPVMNNCN